MHTLRKLTRVVADVIVPPRCALCGLITGSGACCEPCEADFTINSDACRTCARPLAGGGVCGACQRRPPPFAAVVAPYRYDYPLDAVIRGFKFRGRSQHAAVLRELMVHSAHALPRDLDALVAMPMHWRRRATRGFNHAEVLATPLARHLALPLFRNAYRVRHTPPQSTLDSKARTRSLRGAFAVDGRIDPNHVLIVDDVLTTGHTARQFAHTLRAAGAQRVSLIVVARAG